MQTLNEAGSMSNDLHEQSIGPTRENLPSVFATILNEISKPPVNKTCFFQYSQFIIKLFEMIFDIWNITPFCTLG